MSGLPPSANDRVDSVPAQESQHMRLDQDHSTHPRLLGNSALREVSAATDTKVEEKAKEQKGSRFVGPTQLGSEQRSRICEVLKQKKIGDEIGRQIFVGAVEYQISAFAGRLEAGGAPDPETRSRDPALDGTLQAIAEKAGILSALLRELSDSDGDRVIRTLTTQDSLGRSYDERYLCELGCEIDRLERACSAAVGDSEPQESETIPDSTAGPELVAKLAGIFSECFEMEPTAEENGAFRASLRALGEVTGLVIGEEPALLAQVLAARAASRNAS